MLELYHGRTSVCALKVRLALAEKGIDDWTSHLLLLNGDQQTPEYMKLNPNAVVPTLVHDGNVVIESTVIIHYVDEVFDGPALVPADAMNRVRMRYWTKRMDEYVHPSCAVLSFATANRDSLLKLPAEERERQLARTPNKAHAERKRQTVELGLDAPLVIDAVMQHQKMLTLMEEQLGRASFLAGDDWSLADAAVTPYVWRLDKLKLAAMWDGMPRVADWYDRIRQRPSWQAAVEKWMTDEIQARYDKPQPERWPKVKQILDAA